MATRRTPPQSPASASRAPTISSAAVGRPRQLLSRDARQASILAAAARAFARAGFAATSMEDVAGEAGITKLIVYRHFESKEELYRSVLEQVSARMAAEFVRGAGLPDPERQGFTTRSILTVARENPDAFRLLTVHAAREPTFSALADEFHGRGIRVADAMIADMIPDPVLKAWSTRVIVEYLVDGVLSWLEVGDPSRDEEFVAAATRGLQGMFVAWADPDRLPPDLRHP